MEVVAVRAAVGVVETAVAAEVVRAAAGVAVAAVRAAPVPEA